MEFSLGKLPRKLSSKFSDGHNGNGYLAHGSNGSASGKAAGASNWVAFANKLNQVKKLSAPV